MTGPPAGEHHAFGPPWSKHLADYDLTRGRVWLLVLVVTLVAPAWRSASATSEVAP